MQLYKIPHPKSSDNFPVLSPMEPAKHAVRYICYGNIEFVLCAFKVALKAYSKREPQVGESRCIRACESVGISFNSSELHIWKTGIKSDHRWLLKTQRK